MSGKFIKLEITQNSEIKTLISFVVLEIYCCVTLEGITEKKYHSYTTLRKTV